jgi:hypothetical protein
LLLESFESGERLQIQSIQHAKDVFDYGRHLLMHVHGLATQPKRDSSEALKETQRRHSYIESVIANFSDALGDFAKCKRGSLMITEEMSIAVLQLHTLYAHVSLHLKHAGHLSESQREALLPQMTEIVRLGNRIISFRNNDAEGPTRLPSFCLDVGYVIPLYTVASQALCHSLRREAIALLRSVRRQEGLWNSMLVADAAQRIMEIEETDDVQLIGGGIDSQDHGPQQYLPEVLQLDAKGGQLHYRLQSCGEKNSIVVKERVFNWYM